MPSHGLLPPKEGQVEKELEEQRLEAIRKQEENELWARIALEVPGGVVQKGEAKQLEIDDGALEILDAEAGKLEATPAVRIRTEAEAAGDLEDGDVDVPLNQPAAEYESLPYERDRPLTAEELAQAPPTTEALDDFGGELDAKDEEEYLGGIRDERDPK